jgi:hypothetical protein
VKKTIVLTFVIACTLSAATLQESKNEKLSSIQKSQETQRSINTADDATKQMYEEYKSYLAQLNTQKRYNAQLEELILSQDVEKKTLLQDIDKIEHTHKNIVPLMQNMIESLEKFINLDTPFLKEERLKRVAKLKTNLKRADISVSDKYRQLLEAYVVENDYARTIESYKSKLDGKVVEFLRVGRVGLYYQTLDFKESGMWDSQNKKFVVLESQYNKPILNAIKISKKQLTPDLLTLPLNRGVN